MPLGRLLVSVGHFENGLLGEGFCDYLKPYRQAVGETGPGQPLGQMTAPVVTKRPKERPDPHTAGLAVLEDECQGL